MTRIASQMMFDRWRMARRCAVLIALTLLVGCEARPVERPREGAQPIAGGTPVRLENAVPPTLAPAGSLATTATPTALTGPPPSPSPNVAVSPVGSPGIAPIISNLQPAPGASLPAGDVVIGARISGSSDLVDVIAFIDGVQVPIDLGGTDLRVKVVSLVRPFAAGTHEIRIQARDEHGQLGGYRWQFTVGAARQPTIAVPARPATPPGLTATPFAIPTRRPTVAPAKPTAPAPAASTPAAPAPAVKPATQPPR